MPWTMALFRDPDRYIAELVAAGEAWAEARAEAEQKEKDRDSTLASLVSNFINQGQPAGKSEHLAKANGMYRAAIAAAAEARARADKLKVYYDAGNTFVDLARTTEASRRSGYYAS